MLRSTLLAAARSTTARRLVESSPLTKPVVARFIAGDCLDDALRTASGLAAKGLRVTLDHLGEDTSDLAAARSTTAAYEQLFARLGAGGLACSTEASVKLSAVGQFLGKDGKKIALEQARQICRAAEAVRSTVTLDMEDHSTTDSTLDILGELRADFPWVGAVLQAQLRRTEGDCADLATSGSRVRLCKGAYAEPSSAAYPDKSGVDSSYVRCLKVLLRGAGYPMIATHDPRLIAIATQLISANGRDAGSQEFQMLHGIRPDEQQRIAAAGNIMRVYLPYGDQWYGYFMRRLAERPANVGFFLRSLLSRS